MTNPTHLPGKRVRLSSRLPVSALRQLTIDGGEVSHPPPRPKAYCPECGKLITLNDGGELRHHSNGYGETCPMAGEHLPR